MKFIFKIIFGIAIFLLASNNIKAVEVVESIKNQIQQKEKEIKAIEEKIKQFKSDISDAQEKVATLRERTNLLKNRINNLDLNIKSTDLKILKTKFQIDGFVKKIGIQSNKIGKQKEKISKILNRMYEFNQKELLNIILKYQTISKFLSYEEYLKDLSAELQKNLDIFKDLKTDYEGEKKELEDKKTELSNLNKQLSSQKIIFENQKEELTDLLFKTKNKEQNYQKLLAETEKREKESWKEVNELEEKLQAAIKATFIPAPRKGLLIRPAEGILSQGYGMTSFAKKGAYAGGPHNGIDIANSIGTTIKAALDGEVIAVNNAPYAYGKWIAIKHDNGLTTLYGHLSLQLVSVGQKVSVGQAIGYMGTTGYSSGSHLHFTVYASHTFTTKPSKISGILPVGGHLNPFDYL